MTKARRPNLLRNPTNWKFLARTNQDQNNHEQRHVAISTPQKIRLDLLHAQMRNRKPLFVALLKWIGSGSQLALREWIKWNFAYKTSTHPFLFTKTFWIQTSTYGLPLMYIYTVKSAFKKWLKLKKKSSCTITFAFCLLISLRLKVAGKFVVPGTFAERLADPSNKPRMIIEHQMPPPHRPWKLSYQKE